jgi:hypothetical protein
MTTRIISSDSDLAAALLAVSPGDLLYLRGGIYRQPVQVLRGGKLNMPVQIMAWGDERPIFVLPSVQGSEGQWYVNAPWVTVEGITLKGGDCIRSENLANDCEFRRCTVRNTVGSGISVRGPRTRVEECDLQICGTADNKAHSLYLAASGCTVRRNKLGTSGNGCALHVYNSGAAPSNCIIEDNEIEQWDSLVGAVLFEGTGHQFRRNRVRCYGPRAALVFYFADDILIEDCDAQGFPELIYDQYSTVALPCNVTMRRCKLRGHKETAAGWKLTEEENTRVGA